jgi:hypothetical protein
MHTSAATSAAVFKHIQDFAQNSSVVGPNLGFGMYMDRQTFSLTGTYFGTLEDFSNNIAPELLRTLPTPLSSRVQAVDWLQSLVLLGGLGSLTEPVHGYNAHDNFYAKSVTVPEPLSDAALTAYFDYIISQGASAPTSWFSIINLYGGPGSQINAKDSNFAAYSDRNALWVAQHYGFTDLGVVFPASETTFVDGLNTAMTSQMPGVEFGAYLNYVDPNLSRDEAHALYYSSDVYNRLKTIKAVVDPGNVFFNPQSI